MMSHIISNSKTERKPLYKELLNSQYIRTIEKYKAFWILNYDAAVLDALYFSGGLDACFAH